MEISFWKWRWQNNAARYYFENVNFPAVLRSCSLLPFNWKELTFFTFWKVFACHCWRSHGELNVKWQQPIEVCSWQLSYQTKKSPFRGHFSFCGACTFTYSCHQFYHIIINLCGYCLSLYPYSTKEKLHGFQTINSKLMKRFSLNSINFVNTSECLLFIIRNSQQTIYGIILNIIGRFSPNAWPDTKLMRNKQKNQAWREQRVGENHRVQNKMTKLQKCTCKQLCWCFIMKINEIS